MVEEKRGPGHHDPDPTKIPRQEDRHEHTDGRPIGRISGAYGMGIFAQHAKLLEDSAISVEVARARGYVTVDTQTRLANTGIAKAGRSTPGLLIPIHDVAGQVKLYQYRPDSPRLNGSGRPVKYETSVGRGLVVDVPPTIRSQIQDPSVPLWITEGAREADAAVTVGLCCVDILGVYGWRGSNRQGGKTALACWESIALNGRDIYLCFDSDVMTKREVGQALDRFGQFLASRGAKVQFVYLADGATSETDASNGGLSRDTAKVGLDDFLAAGHSVDDLLALATSELRKPGRGFSDSRATPQHPPPEPPALASDLRILDRFGAAVRRCGVVGEERNAQRLYLLITSRVLDKPVSAAVKGHSSSGKSFTTETTVKFFPPEAVIEMTAMSERALVYSKEDYKHRTLVLYEAVALRENNDDNLTSYFVRSLLSEGRIEYPVTVRGSDGNFTTRTVVKEGPTNMIVTTTKTKMHAENETRVMSLSTDDSREQTARVLLALADESDNGVDLKEWHQLQAWLQHAEHRVTIPYASQLAELVPPVAVRLRRDFGALLAMIRAHAILHQQTRARDDRGRIVATLDDYEVVRDLMAEVIAEGVGSTVSPVVRETVAAVEALAGSEGIKLQPIADRLNVDKSNASRRLRVAADGGYVTNLEDKRGKPGRWEVGDPLPDKHDLLPQLRNTPQPSDQECCGVARESEGENTSDEMFPLSQNGEDPEVARPGAPRHPARWTPTILAAIEPVITTLGLPVHDPFAGTGERLGALCNRVGVPFTGTEIEPEFIVDARVCAGDSTEATSYPTREHVVVTSPVYPNGMADHFKANDTSMRHTYRQALAQTLGYDRELHPNNMGRYAGRTRRGMASEAKHFAIAEACVAHWPDHVIVNVKDVVTKTETVAVVDIWRKLLGAHGYEVSDQIDVAAPGQRQGANGEVRAGTEAVLIARRAPRDDDAVTALDLLEQAFPGLEVADPDDYARRLNPGDLGPIDRTDTKDPWF